MRGSRRSLIHLIPLFSSRPLIHSILKKKQNELDTKRPKMKSILPEDTGTSPKPLWPTPQVKVRTADKGVVEVTNCFCVPHKEHEDLVEAELTYASDMYEMNMKVNKMEAIVGWWATGNEVTSHSSVIHEYYARECPSPVHMTLDTTLSGAHMGIKAYLNVPIGVPGGKSGSMFTPVPVEVLCYEPEVVGIKLCQKTVGVGSKKSVEPMTDLALIAEASSKLTSLLDIVLAYVDDVLADRKQPDNAVGRALLDMVHSVPTMSPEQFEHMFNSNIKDLLMVITLSQLTKTQLQLNEKLTLLTSI